MALLEAHAQHGFELNDGQQQLVKTMATSGARLQLALAPAGTGKTTAMGALAAAWANSGGNVIGLAPTASAAEVLAEDTGVTTDTMAKFVQLAEPADRRCGPPPAPDDPARKWFKTIGSNTLLIVDEAGKASTFDLDAVIGYALARGASVRLVGDDQQLASISAGGVISDIAARHETLTLSTVVRFADPGESAASLAMREGDPAGIAYYIDHRRVHVGADQTAADMAYAAWAADIAAGRDSILLAPTNEQVAELNERARLDRLTTGRRSASATVTLGDGLTASAGDWIATRKNARWLHLKGGNGWVKNGHRWVIRRRTPRRLGDSVTAARARQRQDRAPARRLHRRPHHPGLRQHHRQRPRRDRRRARHRRHLPHRRLRSAHPPAALRRAAPAARTKTTSTSPPPKPTPTASWRPKPPTPHRRRHPLGDPAPRRRPSLRPQRRAPPNPIRSPGCTRAAAMYADALTAAAEHTAGAATMAHIDAAATAIRATITDYGAWPVLRRNLALLAVDGHDPIEALHARRRHPLGNPIDVAAVLDWRLQPPPGSAAERVGPLRWLPAIPDALTAHPQWGPYLDARAPARRRSGRPDPRRRAPMAARAPSRPGRAHCWPSNPS